MKGKRVIIPTDLWTQAPDQLHNNHMDIKHKTTSKKNIDWVNMNAHIENKTKSHSTPLGFQLIKPKEKIISHKITGRLQEVIGVEHLQLVTVVSFSL